MLAIAAALVACCTTSVLAQGMGPAAPVFQPGQLPGGPPIDWGAIQQAGYHSACDSCNQGCGSCDGASDCGCATCKSGLLGQVADWNFSADIEYLFWWPQGRALPPLVTTGPATNRNVNPQPASLAQPGVQVLFGNGREGADLQSGGRLTLMGWTDDYQTAGIGGRFWGINGKNEGFFQSSQGNPVLGNPFFNVVPLNAPDAALVSFPGELAGFINIESKMDLLNAEAFARLMIMRGCGYRLDFIGGYQFSRLDDMLSINGVTTIIDPANVNLGTQFDNLDIFEARNQFHGGALGLIGEFYQGPWKLTAMGKVAYGNMHQQVLINGRTTITPNGGNPNTTVGGLYAQASNIGAYDRDVQSLMPEVGLTLSYCISERVELSAGYSFVYWSRVALPGDHIDQNIDTRQFVGIPGTQPAFPGIQSSDFWMMGGNLGAKIKF